MTDPVVRLETDRLVVEPGGQARVTVYVRNVGAIVEGFQLTVLGQAAEWAETLPPEVAVYPEEEASAVVVVTAPAGAVAASGVLPFGVLAASVVDPAGSASAEGDLEIGRVQGLSAALSPVTSAGRWSGRHVLQVKNWGNAPAALAVSTSDPDQRLGFLVHPARLDIPVGETATSAVRVRTRAPFLRGPVTRIPFQVALDPVDAEPSVPPPQYRVGDPTRPVLDGALNQKPVLTRAALGVGALAVVAVAGAAFAVSRFERDPIPELTLVSSIAAPAGLTAAPAAEPAAVQLAWAPSEVPPESYRVLQIDPRTRDNTPPVTEKVHPDVPQEQTKALLTDLPPGVEACFQLVAVRGDGRSSPSEPVCATPAAPVPLEATESGSAEPPTTEPGSTATTTTEPTSTELTTTETIGPTATGTTGPTATETATTGPTTTESPTTSATGPGPDDVIIVASPIPMTGNPAEDVLVAEELARLEGEGHKAGVLESPEYPDFEPALRQPTHVVYVGPFLSEEEARAYCAANLPEDPCTVWRPGPRQADG